MRQKYVELQMKVDSIERQLEEHASAIRRIESDNKEILNGRASNYADKYKEQQSDAYSGAAIAAFVLGILAIGSSFIPVVNVWSIIVGAVGFILGIVGGVQTARKKRKGAVLNAIGLVLCIVSIGMALVTNTVFSAAVDNLRTGSKPVATTGASGGSAPASDGSADYSNMPIGQSVSLQNGLTVTVVDAQEVKQTYSDEMLMMVTVSYVNNGSDSVSYNALDWKSVNANGVERMEKIFGGDSGNRLDSGKLKPGGNITGSVYFEGDATKVYYYSNGLFQSESQICWNIR